MMKTALSSSGSHTIHSQHPSAPLKVPRRPPRNDVTLAIQKFVPYVVVFLLSLMVYSSFKSPSPSDYPPYSPPNMIHESTHSSLLQFAKDMIESRIELFNDVKTRADANTDVNNIGRWGAWRAQKAAELNRLVEAGNSEARNLGDVISGFNKMSGLKTNSGVEQVGEWMESSGETAETSAQDTISTLKQKAEELKEKAAEVVMPTFEVAQEKLEEVQHTVESMEHKAEEAVFSARDTLQSAFDSAQETLETVIGKDNIDMLHAKMGEAAEDHANLKVDTIIQQLLSLGDEAVEEALGKLGATRECRCPDQETMCPK